MRRTLLSTLFSVLIFAPLCFSALAASNGPGKLAGCAISQSQCNKDCGGGRLCTTHCQIEYKSCVSGGPDRDCGYPCPIRPQARKQPAIGVDRNSTIKVDGKNVSGATSSGLNHPETKGPMETGRNGGGPRGTSGGGGGGGGGRH